MAGNLLTYDGKAPSTILRDELELLKVHIQQNLASSGTNASGKTSESLRVEVDEHGGKLIGRPFFHGVETGRGPGGVPRNFQAIILDWMNAKGVHADDGDDQGMAQGIAWKIRRQGTSLWRRTKDSGGIKTIYTNELQITMQNIQQRLSYLIARSFKTINEEIRRKLT